MTVVDFHNGQDKINNKIPRVIKGSDFEGERVGSRESCEESGKRKTVNATLDPETEGRKNAAWCMKQKDSDY